MSILVCVPTFNEEESVKDIILLLKEKKLDFIICDGFSTDNTVDIAKAENAECIMREKPGKGFAVTKCLELASLRGYKFMATIDCDMTYSVYDIINLHKLAEENSFDMVVGERPFSNIAWHRRIANYIVSFYFNLLFSSKIKDILSGLRILKVDIFANNIYANSFDVEPRTIAFTVKNKLNYIGIPIDYYDRIGNSKANLKELALILWGTLDERLKS